MNTTLTIKTPKKLRDDAKRTAETMGIPLTTVVNGMLRQFVLDQEITFSTNVPNAETRRAIEEARNPKIRGKSYATADKMFQDLLGKNWRKPA